MAVALERIGKAQVRALSGKSNGGSTDAAAKLHRRLFGAQKADFATRLEAVLDVAAQEDRFYEKRSRHEVGKEDVGWEQRYKSRGYPSASIRLSEDERGGVSNIGRLSSFSLNFTCLADCSASGMLPYGAQVFPPTRSSGEAGNFRFLPFPLNVPACQQVHYSGQQTTRDRPFTIAENLMKTQMQTELYTCLLPQSRPDGCVSNADMVRDGSVGDVISGGNCTLQCPEFLECVEEALRNNRTAEAGAVCRNSAAGRTCTARSPATFDDDGIRSGNVGICLAYDCLYCAVERYDEYFRCAVSCQLLDPDTGSVSNTALDCSYTYEDVHWLLPKLTERIWEAYMLGAVGPYVFSDILNANFTTCATMGEGCVSMTNFRRDAYGIGAVAALDSSDADSVDVAGSSFPSATVGN